jgi:PIN domain nuclease of toxin-antitoxin system
MSTRGGARSFVPTRFLLDTHTFLFLALFHDRLPARLRPLVEDVRNDLHVSLASLWEIQIKINIGKLDIDGPLMTLVTSQQQENGVVVLPIAIAHIVEHNALPLHHRDPFDRMLIAQARVERLTLLSNDAAFNAYDVPVRW